ncbi:hypothetical protein QBC39DRAFT_20498 [Podospora conica]|nr:hypothetical protein QBC39DRAFT_20498 [Schizothecium conicum]
MSCIVVGPCLFLFPAKLTSSDRCFLLTDKRDNGHHTGQVITRTIKCSSTLCKHCRVSRDALFECSTPLPASQTGKPDLEGCIQGRGGCAIPESHISIQGAKGPRTPSRLGARIPGFSDAEHAFSPFVALLKVQMPRPTGGCFSRLAFDTRQGIQCPFASPSSAYQTGRARSSSKHARHMVCRDPGPRNSKGSGNIRQGPLRSSQGSSAGISLSR